MFNSCYFDFNKKFDRELLALTSIRALQNYLHFKKLLCLSVIYSYFHINFLNFDQFIWPVKKIILLIAKLMDVKYTWLLWQGENCRQLLGHHYGSVRLSSIRWGNAVKGMNWGIVILASLKFHFIIIWGKIQIIINTLLNCNLLCNSLMYILKILPSWNLYM